MLHQNTADSSLLSTSRLAYCYSLLACCSTQIGADSDDDDDDDGPCFRMTNTASSYEYFAVFDKHYNKVRKLIRENKLPDAFEYAFALMVRPRKIVDCSNYRI